MVLISMRDSMLVTRFLHSTLLLGMTKVAVEYFAHRPKHAQHEQYAYKRGQMGNALEYGHKDEATHAQEEYYLALACRQVTGRGGSLWCGRVAELALEAVLHDKGWNDHRHYRGYEYLLYHACGCDEALVPKHDGGYIANGREGTARIGGYDNERGILDAVLVVAHELAQYHYHHNARGKVVEYGRQEECHDGYAPQQTALAGGAHQVAHKVKATVLVDELNNGHGTHQEEQGGRCGAKVVLYHLAHGLRYFVANGGGKVLAWVEHEDGPTAHKHEQSNGGFVDFCKAFDGYQEVAQYEYSHNQCGKCSHYALCFKSS